MSKEGLLKKLVNKFLHVYVNLKHGTKIPNEYFWFYRDTYYCKLLQWKFFFRDYVFRKPYKTVFFSGEFAPETMYALPFAYWHFKNGTLKTTKSAKLTKELYFFSPDHQEVFEERTNEGNYNFDTARVIYSHDYDMKKWLPVPLKETYQNAIYRYEKPILIIANRFNKEWDGPPVSFISYEVLSYIIDELKNDYTIIYNRPQPGNIVMDNSEIYEMNEFDKLKEFYPEVLLMEDLYRENKIGANNFNHFQLLVYANADHFISVHGGTATLASYFGGTNIILSKKGPEHYFRCFESLFPKLSGATIHHAKTDEELKQFIKLYKTQA